MGGDRFLWIKKPHMDVLGKQKWKTKQKLSMHNNKRRTQRNKPATTTLTTHVYECMHTCSWFCVAVSKFTAAGLWFFLHFSFFNSERSRSNCPLCRERVAGSDDTWVLTEKPESSDYETDLKGYLVGLADRTTWAWHFVASFIFWLPDDRLQWDISTLSLLSCCPTDMSVIFSAIFLLTSMQKTSTVFFRFFLGRPLWSRPSFCWLNYVSIAFLSLCPTSFLLSDHEMV